MAQYKLISGKHTYVDAEGKRVAVAQGDVIELTAAQAVSFADRFELVVTAEVAKPAAEPTKPESVSAVEPTKPTVKPTKPEA